MDQSQNGMGDWSQSRFGGWSQEPFNAGMPFNQNQASQSAYHDPNAYTGNHGGLSHQLGGNTISQGQQYPDFATIYSNQQSSSWADPVNNHSQYPQTNHADTSQRAYVDLAPNGQYFNGIDLDGPDADSQYHGSINSSTPTPQAGFHHGVIQQQPPQQQPLQQQPQAPPQSQWQQMMQHAPNGYGSPPNYGSPLAAAQAANARGKTASPASYSTNRPQPSGSVQTFQPVLQAAAQQAAHALSQTPNQPVARLSTTQPPTRPPSQVQPQPLSRPTAQPSTQQSNSVPGKALSQSQAALSNAALHKSIQPGVSQMIPKMAQPVAQRTESPKIQPTPQTSQASIPNVSQARFMPTVDADAIVMQKPTFPHQLQPSAPSAQIVRKVSQPAAIPPKQTLSVQQNQPPLTSGLTSYLRIDEEYKEMAEENAEYGWQGVPNVAISNEPVILRVPERIPRHTLYLKEVKGPLFTDKERESLWTAAEILGWHLNEYLRFPRDAKYDKERLKTDAIMDVMLKRAGKTVAKTWWSDSIPNEAKKRKLADWMPGSAPSKRQDTPEDEILRLEVKVNAILATPIIPLDKVYQLKPTYVKKMADEYSQILAWTVEEVKGSKVFTALSKAYSERKKKGASAELDARISQLKKEMRPALKMLACTLDCFLGQDRGPLVRFLGLKKQSNIIGLFNTIIRLLNIKEGKSALMMSVLQFLSLLSSVKPSELDTWKFTSSEGKTCAKVQLEALNNDEVNKLVGVILANAERNKANDNGPSEKTASESKGQGTGVKKVVKNGTSATGTLGAKRAREDDGDVRVSKKVATETNGSLTAGTSQGALKSGSTVSKASAISAANKAAPAKSSSGETTASAKPRSGLLLPGKIRPVAKPMPKAPVLKTEAEKSTKPETGIKPQGAKTEANMATSQPQRPEGSATISSDTAKAAKPKAADAPSSLAALLAEIDEPNRKASKSAPKVVAQPHDPNESDQQKTRRLRKEERRRRGLRVTFKSDDRLVEIREFERDEGEMGGSNAVRDVKSDSKDKMEGMALKKGLAGEIRPWEEPTPVDLSVIPEDKRQQTFVTRGGNLTFHTDEQKVMQEREKTELMVIYTDAADIPPTPKSPNLDSAELVEMSQEVPVTRVPEFQPEASKYDEYRQRERELICFGLPAVIQYAWHRKNTNGENLVNRWQPGPTADPYIAAARDAENLQLLKSSRIRNYTEPARKRPKTSRRLDHPDPSVQKQLDFAEDLIVDFVAREEERKKQQPAVQQDVVMTDAPDFAASQTKPVPAVPAAQPGQDFTAAWAAYYTQYAQAQAAQQAVVQQPNAYAQSYSNPYQAVQQSADGGAQLNALLATLGGAAAQPHQQQQQTLAADQVQALMAALGSGKKQQAGQQNPGQNNEYLLSLAQWAAGQGANAQQQKAPSQPSYGGYNGPSSYPMQRDDSHNNSYSGNDRDGGFGGDRDRERGGKRAKSNKGGGGSRGGGSGDVPDHLRGVNPNLIGTKPCTFWAQNKCNKGDKCTFRHDPRD